MKDLVLSLLGLRLLNGVGSVPGLGISTWRWVHPKRKKKMFAIFCSTSFLYIPEVNCYHYVTSNHPYHCSVSAYSCTSCLSPSWSVVISCISLLHSFFCLFVFFFLVFFFFFFFAPYPWPVEVPRPRIQPEPQLKPISQLWQCQILNPMCRKGTSSFLHSGFNFFLLKPHLLVVH